MSKTRRSVGEDRENDSLSMFGEEMHKAMSSYVDEHPRANFLFIGGDAKGYFVSGIGNPEILAKAFIQGATKDEVILKTLLRITEETLKILKKE